MNERHRAQRVVDAVLSVRERIFDRQNEARRQLSQGAPCVHERRGVRLEAALRHEIVELASRRSYSLITRPVTSVSLGDTRGDAPEHILRRLCRVALSVLDQIALFDDSPRILIE